MKKLNEMTPSEIADLLEEKAKKLRETNDLNGVIGGEKDDPEGGCPGGCCGSKCVYNSDNCDIARSGDESCRRTCIIKSSN